MDKVLRTQSRAAAICKAWYVWRKWYQVYVDEILCTRGDLVSWRIMLFLLSEVVNVGGPSNYKLKESIVNLLVVGIVLNVDWNWTTIHRPFTRTLHLFEYILGLIQKKISSIARSRLWGKYRLISGAYPKFHHDSSSQLVPPPLIIQVHTDQIL